MTNHRIQQAFLLLILVLCAMFIAPRPAAAQVPQTIVKEYVLPLGHTVWGNCLAVRKERGTPGNLKQCSDDTLARNHVIDEHRMPAGLRYTMLVNTLPGEVIAQPRPADASKSTPAVPETLVEPATAKPIPLLFKIIGIAIAAAALLGLLYWLYLEHLKRQPYKHTDEAEFTPAATEEAEGEEEEAVTTESRVQDAEFEEEEPEEASHEPSSNDAETSR